MGEVGAPVPIAPHHLCSQFICRHPELAQWLQRRALSNALAGATKTYVVCTDEHAVVGYYGLAAGSLLLDAVPGRMRRNMPNPLPVIVLARLAVHTEWEGRGLGSGLLKDALLRSLQASSIVGARALLAHAIDAQAAGFYRRHGFVESIGRPQTLLLPLT